MKLGAPRTHAVTAAASSISMSAHYAGLFGLLQPGFNALRVGMHVDKRVLSAISSVHETTMNSTEHADLALQSGDAMGATPWHWPYHRAYALRVARQQLFGARLAVRIWSSRAASVNLASHGSPHRVAIVGTSSALVILRGTHALSMAAPGTVSIAGHA